MFKKEIIKGLDVKVVVGASVLGLGLLCKEIKQYKKVNKLNKLLGLLGEKHNMLVDHVEVSMENMIDLEDKVEFNGHCIDYLNIEQKETKEKVNQAVNVSLELMDNIEEEIGSVYDHIEEVEKRENE